MKRTILLALLAWAANGPAADLVAHGAASTNEWATRRAEILRRMQEVMGPLPGGEKRGALNVQVISETNCGDFIRREITYESEPNSPVPAYLLIPAAATGSQKKHPAVLALHQTHSLGYKVVVGLGSSPNDEYAVELARGGYVCLAPAYPLLANYQPDLKKMGYASGTMKAIWDNVRGIDLLQSLPFVRAGGVAAIGHSLGGHNGIYTAAFDQRIKVIVSSCGFDSYRDYMGGNIAGWTSERYMPRLKGYAPAAFPFDFHDVIAALAPRALFVSAPMGDLNFKWRSVDDVAAAARPIFALHGKPDNLRIEHPNCGHVFPLEMREAAYAMIARELE